MIKDSIEVLVVKKIKHPFQYLKAHVNGVNKYVKDYRNDSLFYLDKEDLKTVQITTGTTVLIKRNKDYFWCEHFEEIYKSLGILTRFKLIRNTSIYIQAENNIILKTKVRGAKYSTNDVKRILIK